MHKNFSIILVTFFATVVTLPISARILSPINIHFGMCDASAAVPLGADLFVVANDEDSILRIFRNNESGKPIYSQDLSSFLEINPKHPEPDIEGATLIKNRIYWITSHGANKDGKGRPNRHRFFATDIDNTDGKVSLKPIGKPFLNLVKAFDDSAELKKYHLAEAARNAPESQNALNIEGLTKTPQGSLLIGFRNPIPEGKALLIPLENPHEIIVGNEIPKFGKPILLPLGGLGIRSIEYSHANEMYMIIAGPYDDNGSFQFFTWSGNLSEAPVLANIHLKGLNPEALVIFPDKGSTKAMILSDDGSRSINGQNCKSLVKRQDKAFRSTWLEIESR